MKPKIIPLVLLLFAVLLSACSMSNLSGNDPLEGTSWELVAIGKHRPIEDSHISISFEGGQASGSSGCNRYGGGYKVEGDNIVFDAMVMTEMACANKNMMNQELEYMQRLGNAERFELLEGHLLIYSSDTETLNFIPVPIP